MENRDIENPPVWINRLLMLASLYACVTALAAVMLARPKSDYRHAERIADISVNLNGTYIREHCTTCHPGGGPAVRKDADELDRARAHPDIAPHSVEKLGCTGCHLGEGMALDTVLSHGLAGFGARGVLRKGQVQASCYTCHELKPLKGAEEAWQGCELFLRLCVICHHVAALGQGGRYGPDLSAVGSHLGLKKIQEAIREPKKEPANSTMPRFPLSRSQVQKVSFFLKSRVSNPFYTTPMLMQTRKAEIPSAGRSHPKDLASYGRHLLEGKKCLACHAFGKEDGRIGPDLTFIGRMRDRDYLRDFLSDPLRRIPDNIMPKFPSTEEETSALVVFLSTKAVDSPRRLDPQSLYMALCQRCHAAAGDGFGMIQPNLANFPRAFKDNAEFFRRAPDLRIVRSIDNGIPGTSMPPYDGLLSDTERDRLVNLIFRMFIRVSRDEKVEHAPIPEEPVDSSTRKMGERAFDRECVRCHGIVGNGRGPEYVKHVPRPRNLTNQPYFSSLDDARLVRTLLYGVPGTAMASYRATFTSREVWGLVGNIRRLSGTQSRGIADHDSKGMAP